MRVLCFNQTVDISHIMPSMEILSLGTILKEVRDICSSKAQFFLYGHITIFHFTTLPSEVLQGPPTLVSGLST